MLLLPILSKIKMSIGLYRAILFLSSALVIILLNNRIFEMNQYDDLSQYFYFYQGLNSFSDVANFLIYDPLFTIYLYFLKLLGVSSINELNLAFNLTCIGFMFALSFRLNNKLPAYYFILFTIISPFFIVYIGQFSRQGISLIILTYFLSYERKLYRLSGVFLASLIHMSSVLALPAIFIEKINVKYSFIIFIIFLLITYIFPLDNSFVSLFSQGDYLYGKFEYWLNDDIEAGGIVFKWLPVFTVSLLLLFLFNKFKKFNGKIFNEFISNFEARSIFLLFYFTIIGFWGRYLNAFSLRFGLWAVIFGLSAIFIFKENFARYFYLSLFSISGLAFIYSIGTRNSDDFLYIYRYVFLPILYFSD